MSSDLDIVFDGGASLPAQCQEILDPSADDHSQSAKGAGSQSKRARSKQPDNKDAGATRKRRKGEDVQTLSRSFTCWKVTPDTGCDFNVCVFID